MRQLKVDENNSIDGWDLYSTMLFPEDKSIRDILYNLKKNEELIETLKAEKQPAAVLPLAQLELLLALSTIKDFKQLQEKAQIQGETAGLVLLFIYYLEQSGYREPSIKKAIFLCERYLKNKKTPNNKKYPTSKPSIRQAWNTYESVAHIWATLIFFIHSDIIDGNDAIVNKELIFGSLQLKMLSVSKTFLEFGINTSSTRDKDNKKLIDKKNSWIPPSEIKLETVPLNIETPPKFITDTIKKYRAPISKI